MATFTVRIVLHDADSSEYSVLYEAMNDEEFSDIISSEDGIDYNMPDGEYTISGNYTKSNILEKGITSPTLKKINMGFISSPTLTL